MRIKFSRDLDFLLQVLKNCKHNEIYSLFKLGPKFYNPGTGTFYTRIQPLITEKVFILVEREPPRYKFDRKRLIRIILDHPKFRELVRELELAEVWDIF